MTIHIDTLELPQTCKSGDHHQSTNLQPNDCNLWRPDIYKKEYGMVSTTEHWIGQQLLERHMTKLQRRQCSRIHPR